MSNLTLTGAGPQTGGAAFDPASVAGLQAWYKADAGTSTTTDGVAISQWNDQSGNTRHLAQATGSLQPLYKAAIQNGQPVVRFDGTDDVLTATFTLNQTVHLFAVLVFRIAYAGNAIAVCGNNASNNGSLFRTSSTDVSLFAGSTGCAVTTTPQAWHSYSGLFNGVSSENRVDGGTASTGNAGVNAFAGLTAGAGTGGAPQPAAADIGEILAYSPSLNAADRQSVESYLRAKWGTP